MPLSEFLRLAMEKLEASKKKSCSINDSSTKGNNLVEVVWENGPGPTHHSFSPQTPSFPDSATANLGGVAPSGPLGYHSECSPQDSHVPSGATMEDTFMETDKALAQSNTDNSTLVIDGDTSGEPVVAYEQKRKLCDIESECRNDDIQHDSIGEKKATRSKRSRTTEVHNLSERRRRDRINEKMRALQELIPNCNKADKASMLDDAIQYLKNLQYQLHIMSTGGGLCMPPMMFPSQHMHPAPMPHFSHLSFENINSGSHPRPIFPVPSIRGGHFPVSTLGHMYFQGISGPHFPIHGTHPRAPPAVSPLAASSTQNKASNLDFEDPLCSKNSLNMNL